MSLVTAGAGYLVGSVPIGYVIGRLRGVDLRAEGSGNIGATNAGRALGWRWGALIFALDAGKGWVSAAPIAAYFAAGTAGGLVGGLAAVVGHCWSPWLGLDGGKGVATSLGALLAWSPFTALAAAVVWLLVAARWRIASVASVCAAATVVLAGPVIDHVRAADEHGLRVGAIVALAIIIGWRHRANLGRLRKGTEPTLSKDTSGAGS